MFPTFISILDIQSWWEVPNIAHFCSLFRTAFNLLDFDIEDLEEALLTDGTEESSWLQELIVRLLSGCIPNNEISTFNYQMFLRRLFRQKCQEHDRYNPFNTDCDFTLLPLKTKVDILYALCDFRLDADDVLDQLKNLEADSLRVEPLGYDSNDSAYWYFYGTRLYREDFKTKNNKKKSIWQVICFTEDDWFQLTKKFKNSALKPERALYHTLSKNFLPELPRLFKEKERQARRRLLENQPRRTSDRLRKLDGETTEKLEEINHEGEGEKLTPEEEEYRKHKELENKRKAAYERRSKLKDLSDASQSEQEADERHEMAGRKKGRGRQRKASESVDSKEVSNIKRKKTRNSEKHGESNSKSKLAPVGRQTNNSLSAADGQIVIQPAGNTTTNKKKLKTSQVFQQTDEDLQVGLHKILDLVKNHEDAWPFLDPVEEEYAPNYYSIIRRPMDLQRMEDRLDQGCYKTFDKFRSDFQLIVNNCRLYNGVENEYTEMVDNLLTVFERATEKYLDQISSSDEEIAVENLGSDLDNNKDRDPKNQTKHSKKLKKHESPPRSLNRGRKPALAAQGKRRERSPSEESVKSLPKEIIEEKPKKPKRVDREITEKESKKIEKKHKIDKESKKIEREFKVEKESKKVDKEFKNEKELKKIEKESKINKELKKVEKDNKIDKESMKFERESKVVKVEKESRKFEKESKVEKETEKTEKEHKLDKDSRKIEKELKIEKESKKADKESKINVNETKKKERDSKIEKESKKAEKESKIESELKIDSESKGMENESKKQARNSKYKKEKLESKKENKCKEKGNKKEGSTSKTGRKKKRASPIRSRSISFSSKSPSLSPVRSILSTPPPSSPDIIHDDQFDFAPKSQGRKRRSQELSDTEDIPQAKKSLNKWNYFAEDPPFSNEEKKITEDLTSRPPLPFSPKPKDKHNKLRETIEKLKAKSEIARLKTCEYDFELDDHLKENEDKNKKSDKDKNRHTKGNSVNNKTKKCSVDIDDGNSSQSEAKKNSSIKNRSQLNNIQPPVLPKPPKQSNYEALSLATEQTLKDINKWLDDTPKFADFSSASNSPSYLALDDFDLLGTPKPEVKKIEKPPIGVKRDIVPATKEIKKKPFKDPSKFFKRREIQRTIDRLQPGKSKGNLITNVQNATKTDEIFPLGPLSKIKDTKNSLIVKTDTNAPKLSLGSVLNSFGKHKFVDDPKKEEEKPEVLKENTEQSVEAKVEESKDETKVLKKDAKKEKDEKEAKAVEEPISVGGATPNLSAWFKAFGAPKAPPPQKKSESKPESTIDEPGVKPEKVPVPGPSPSLDSPQPITRQRRISTGSSMSERSSFSQDLDSPRVGMDERGAYPAPYPSPLHRSPSGASPVMASPRPDISPRSAYPAFNGQMRVGFYQDTVSNKSSPEKSCSPRDNPQSPFYPSSEHVYAPNTTQSNMYSYSNSPYYSHATPNYSSTNPTPPYNTDVSSPAYYDTSKSLTDQYQAKAPQNYTANSPSSSQPSPANQPQHSPHSPIVHPQMSPIVHSQHSPSLHSPSMHSPNVNSPKLHSPNMSVHSPNMSVHSPNMSVHSPNMSVHSPNMNVHSPNMSVNSPNMTVHSPNMSVHSPNMIVHSPSMNVNSPNINVHSPSMSVRSPHHSQVNSPLPQHSPGINSQLSPGLGVHSPSMNVNSPHHSQVHSPMNSLSVEAFHPLNDDGLSGDASVGDKGNGAVFPVKKRTYNEEDVQGQCVGLQNEVVNRSLQMGHQVPINSNNKTESELNLQQQQQQQQQLQQQLLLQQHKLLQQQQAHQQQPPQITMVYSKSSDASLSTPPPIQQQPQVQQQPQTQQQQQSIQQPQPARQTQLQQQVASANDTTDPTPSSVRNMSYPTSSAQSNPYNPNYNNAGAYPLNIPTARSIQQHQQKLDLSKFTNMGYSGPEVNFSRALQQQYGRSELSYTRTTVQSTTSQASQVLSNSQPSASNPASLPGYQKQTTNVHYSSNRSVDAVAERLAAAQAQQEVSGGYNAEMATSRSNYNSSSIDVEQSLGLGRNISNLSHIVDRYSNEERMMAGLQSSANPYYTDKGLGTSHMFNKTMPSASQIFSQANMAAMSSYNQSMQTTVTSMYNRQMNELQAQQIELKPSAQSLAQDRKTRKKKSSKTGTMSDGQTPIAATSSATPAGSVQGFQSYGGLKAPPTGATPNLTATSNLSGTPLEPGAISLKSASVVPGSAFNFGPTAPGALGLGSALYGDKDAYSNLFDEFRSAPNFYMAAAAAHHRLTPESTGGAKSSQSGNASQTYHSFLNPAHQGRASAYPLGGPFIPPSAQAQLMDTSSQLYQHYLQAGVLNQGLLGPAGAYPPGYHAALAMRQPYDSMSRPSWL